MHQFIAPKILKINGQAAPCRCTDKIICEYCVQANLVLWEKQQHPEKETQKKIIANLKAHGVRKTARILKIRPATVISWIKRGNVPTHYIEILQGVSQT